MGIFESYEESVLFEKRAKRNTSDYELFTLGGKRHKYNIMNSCNFFIFTQTITAYIYAFRNI